MKHVRAEFTFRHLKYEMFSNDTTFVVRENARRAQEWKSGNDLLDGFSTGHEGPLPERDPSSPTLLTRYPPVHEQ